MSVFSSPTMGAPAPRLGGPRQAAMGPAPTSVTVTSASGDRFTLAATASTRAGATRPPATAITRSVALGALPMLAMIDGGVSLLMLVASTAVLKVWQLVRGRDETSCEVDGQRVSFSAVIQKAEVMCATNKFADAARLYELIGKWEKAADAHYRHAIQRLWDGDVQGAEEVFRRVLQVVEDSSISEIAYRAKWLGELNAFNLHLEAEVSGLRTTCEVLRAQHEVLRDELEIARASSVDPVSVALMPKKLSDA